MRSKYLRQLFTESGFARKVLFSQRHAGKSCYLIGKSYGYGSSKAVLLERNVCKYPGRRTFCCLIAFGHYDHATAAHCLGHVVSYRDESEAFLYAHILANSKEFITAPRIEHRSRLIEYEEFLVCEHGPCYWPPERLEASRSLKS